MTRPSARHAAPAFTGHRVTTYQDHASQEPQKALSNPEQNQLCVAHVPGSGHEIPCVLLVSTHYGVEGRKEAGLPHSWPPRGCVGCSLGAWPWGLAHGLNFSHVTFCIHK